MSRAALLLIASTLVVAPGCQQKTPPPAAQAPAQGEHPLQGQVAERVDAPPYTYLRLTTAEGERWAAVPQSEVAVGSQVSVANPLPMRNFESKSLKRTFDLVFFGTLQQPGAAPMGKVPSLGTGAAPHAGSGTPPVADMVVAPVPKAPGAEARTVADVHAQSAALAGKAVAVQGEVVKVNTEIMGKNWIHLRDGSGKGDNADLTFTTQDKAAVGDVVVARGTVRTNKDFGAGYSYAVIVEDAKLSPGKR